MSSAASRRAAYLELSKSLPEFCQALGVERANGLGQVPALHHDGITMLAHEVQTLFTEGTATSSHALANVLPEQGSTGLASCLPKLSAGES